MTDATTSGPRRRHGIPSYPLAFLGLALLLLGAAGAQTLAERGPEPIGVAMLIVGIGALGWMIWRSSWSGAVRYLASAPAAVLTLTAICFGTMVGTFVLQGVPTESFLDRYGAIGGLLYSVHADDIFHSWAFVCCLALVGLTSVATLWVRRRALRKWPHVGRLATHLAVILVLVGGFAGWMWGDKGMVHLEIGQASDTFVVSPSAEHPRGEKLDLGFTLRLDDFELDHYEPEFKLYTYARDSDQSKKGYQVAVADKPAPGLEVRGANGMTIRVDEVYRRLRVVRGFVAAPDAAPGAGSPPRPAARATIDGSVAWLAPEGAHTAAYRDPGGRFELLVSWDEPPAALLAGLGKGGGQASHRVTPTGGQPIQVQPGKAYQLADGGRLLVQAFYPDFTYDLKSRRAATKSPEPKNPGLAVQLVPAGGDPAAAKVTYLFPSRGAAAAHGSQALSYEFTPQQPGAGRAIVLVGATDERLDVASGEVVARGPAGWGAPLDLASVAPGARITIEEPIRRAAPRVERINATEGPLNAALEVTILRPGQPDQAATLLAANAKPIDLGQGRLLVFKERPDGIKNFKSTLTIVDGGQEVLTQLIRVNEPLDYAGVHLYQANYDPDNPLYSGIQVVRDPGLNLVLAGLWVLMAGVAHAITLSRWKPWWSRRRRRQLARNEAPLTPEEVQA